MHDDSYDILLVEADATAAERLRAVFSSRSDIFRLRVAHDVAEARAELAARLPTLVITDVDLPDGDAVGLIPAPLGASYPVIVLAEHGDERAAVDVIRAGALDYVVKSEATLADMPHIAEHAISEWRTASDCLRAREAERAFGARLKAILGAIPDILVELGGDGVIRWLNDAGRAFFGEGAAGRRIEDHAEAPTSDLGVGPCYAKEWAEGPRRELWLRRQDGEPRLLAWWSRAIDGPAGQEAFLASARDITDTRRLQGQFLHAQKLEAVGALASGIAHDFNNLLMGIRGCADMCVRLLDEQPEARELVEDIKTETGRGAALTRQLLAFSRKREVELELIDLNALMAQNDTALRRLLGAGIDLRVQLAAVDGRLRADPNQLEQVLWNLVVNARDAMSAGGHLIVSVGQVDLDAELVRRFGDLEPGNYLTLTVSDNGRGMDEETRAHALEPFFTTKGEGEGTGLGLSTACDIVRRHGGDMQIASEVGHGTTVRIYLPRGTTELASPDDSGEFPASLHGDETVLVVEDEPLVRRTVVHYLQRWGYHVIEAAAGKDALRLCEQSGLTIDLVLLDVVLPGPSGAEVARQVAQLRPSLPVLHMSACPIGKLVREGLLPAGSVALQKPFTEDELLVAVRRALAQPPPAAAADAGASTMLRRGTILLVEDHAPSRLAVKVLFEDEGYEVLAAADGATAVQLCLEHDGDIDVLLTDFGLPDVGLTAFLRQVRELKPPRGVICMSGRSAHDPEIRHATTMADVNFVEKPIDFSQLCRLVDRMIQGDGAVEADVAGGS